MKLWIVVLLTAKLVAAWKSPFMRYNNSKSVQMKLQKKKLEAYTKDEWRGIMESLEPKLDGPIVNLDEDYNGPGAPVLAKSMRIVNGKTNPRGHFPWQVGILIDDDSFCGGALISSTYVVTAAHCLQGAKTFALLMGAQNRSAFETGRLTIETSRAIMHPKWNKDLVTNDIALLPLPYPIPETNFIKTIRLPKRSSGTVKYDGFNVTACGWGKTSDGDPGPTANLNCARLKVISNAECSKLYGTDSFKATNLCAKGYNDMSTCNGDSGGPLIYQEKDKGWTLIGLVSYGAAASCEVGYPDVFTRLTSYLSWVSNQTGIAIRP